MLLRYLNSLLYMLWFRFNEILNLNLESLSNYDFKNADLINLHPHYVFIHLMLRFLDYYKMFKCYLYYYLNE